MYKLDSISILCDKHTHTHTIVKSIYFAFNSEFKNNSHLD